MSDLLVSAYTFVLIALAVMVWPPPEPVELADRRLLAGLREFVARRE